MFTAATQYKYVSEVVWLPTYLVLGAVTSAFFGSTAIGLVAVIIMLILCRMILELLYRIAFGDARLKWQVGAIAFTLQIVVWGALWAWFAENGKA